MSGRRKFVDVAKEAMGRSSLSKGMGFSNVRIVLEHVVKHVPERTLQRRVRFEWKRMKGRASDAKRWSMGDFAAGIVSKKGQYIVCGKAKRDSSKHVKLVKIVNDVVNKVEQIKLFTDHEVKGSCDHANRIVSEGDGGECKLYENTWTVPVKSYTLPNSMSSLSSAKCFFFEI